MLLSGEILKKKAGDAPTDEIKDNRHGDTKRGADSRKYWICVSGSRAASEPKFWEVVWYHFTNDVDWMNNSFRRRKSEALGFLVADTGKEYYVLTECMGGGYGGPEFL